MSKRGSVSVRLRSTTYPDRRRCLFAGLAPPPLLVPRCRRSAPLRVVADEHCLPQEGVCPYSITYLQQQLGPPQDVLRDMVRPALADLLPAEMCGVLQHYAPTDRSRCSTSFVRGDARRDMRWAGAMPSPLA